MSWSNLEEVLRQLNDGGLTVEEIQIGRLVRVPAEGDRGRQKTGWYSLHELLIEGGEILLVGAYGNWRDGGGSRKIELRGRKMSDEQREAMKARILADRRESERRRKGAANRAAEEARKVWQKCSETGNSDYLVRKGVQGHGVRYTDKGNLVVPMHDGSGRIRGLQVIYGDPATIKRKGRDKDFWPIGVAKRGTWFQIGSPTWVVLVCEGYATGASLFEATGHPVAIAWDAGNLLPVAEALAKQYPSAYVLVCADDDFLGRCQACGKTTEVAGPNCTHCGEPHGKGNTGVTSASNAALAVGGSYLAPLFADRGTRKLTDFNDMHLADGLQAVRAQVETRLRALEVAPPRAEPPQPGGGGEDLRPIQNTQELLERFALVYGHGGAVFDYQEHALVSLSDMRDACQSREIHRQWQESPGRQIVRIRDVGFDPTGQDTAVRCNLWGGWPTEPRAGSCEALLDLLEFLCTGEEGQAGEVYRWVLKWLAYPIQHPGAKMKTALVLHGPQGAGKNMFFEAVMAIYGQYGRVVDQAAIEDKFNDWASKKLFLIADEVVARAELFHVKNKLKHFVTGDWIRINPKNVAAYDERNHANLVFLSNETQPLVLEQGDRRYAVIWTPPEMPLDFYGRVKAEIDAGGIEALHDHLLNLDLGDFAPHTRPPMTGSKAELVDLGLDSTERFFLAWTAGEVDGVEAMPALSADVYGLYRTWCSSVGISKAAPMHVLLGRLGKRSDCRKRITWWIAPNGSKKQGTFLFPLSAPSEPPEGESQSLWLGKCVDAFRAAAADWKEGVGHV